MSGGAAKLWGFVVSFLAISDVKRSVLTQYRMK